jgi:hypothetical protein
VDGYLRGDMGRQYMHMNNWLTCVVLSLDSRVTEERNVNLMEASFALLNLKRVSFLR